MKHERALTIHPPSTVTNPSATCTLGLGLHSNLLWCIFRTRRGLSQCGPVSAGRWRGSCTEHLTTSFPVEPSWMPPRLTWGIEVMLKEFATAVGRHIVKARAWFILNNILMSFLEEKQLKSFAQIWPQNRFLILWLCEDKSLAIWTSRDQFWKCPNVLRTNKSFHNFISLLSIFIEF